MKLSTKFLALAIGGLLTAAVPALADQVTYTTSGTFSASGTNVFGTAPNTVTFSGASESLFTPGQNTLGGFAVPNGGANITGSGTFTLSISQTVPSVGTSSFQPAFSGTITNAPSGQLILAFSNTSVTIGSVTYALSGLGGPGVPAANDFGINNQGSVTLQAYITTTPEPAFYALTGSGLVGLLAMAIRRKKTQA